MTIYYDYEMSLPKIGLSLLRPDWSILGFDCNCLVSLNSPLTTIYTAEVGWFYWKIIWLYIDFYLVNIICKAKIDFFDNFWKHGNSAKKSNYFYLCSLNSFMASGSKSWRFRIANSQFSSQRMVPALLYLSENKPFSPTDSFGLSKATFL